MEEECDDRHNTLRNQCSVRNYSGNPVWNVVQYPYMPQKPKRNERSGFEMAKKGFIAESYIAFRTFKKAAWTQEKILPLYFITDLLFCTR